MEYQEFYWDSYHPIANFKSDLINASTAVALSNILVAPLNRVRYLVNSFPESNSMFQFKKYGAYRDCLRSVVKNEGTLPLFKGSFNNLARYFPSQAMNFTVKERLRSLLCHFDKEKHPKMFLTSNILSGGLAGMM